MNSYPVGESWSWRLAIHTTTQANKVKTFKIFFFFSVNFRTGLRILLLAVLAKPSSTSCFEITSYFLLVGIMSIFSFFCCRVRVRVNPNPNPYPSRNPNPNPKVFM